VRSSLNRHLLQLEHVVGLSRPRRASIISARRSAAVGDDAITYPSRDDGSGEVATRDAVTT